MIVWVDAQLSPKLALWPEARKLLAEGVPLVEITDRRQPGV